MSNSRAKIIQQVARNLHSVPTSVDPDTVSSSAYVSVVPTLSSLYRFFNWMTRCLGASHPQLLNSVRTALYAEAHVTIMYSRDAGVGQKWLSQADPSRLTNAVYRGRNIPAVLKEFEFWDGHNDKGYLVAKLDSPELHALHRKWREFGLRSSFEDYVPHMTILSPFADDAELVGRLNSALAVNPLDLEFHNERLEPLQK